jgi:tRNA(Arg) A34 adenosine deaminase TadA
MMPMDHLPPASGPSPATGPTITRRTALGWLTALPGVIGFPAWSHRHAGRSVDTPMRPGLEAAVAHALAMAREAEAAGTFGVGGVLVDPRDYRVLRAMRNRVLERLGGALGAVSGVAYPRDPTAHGERQLVSWYLEHRTALELPAPEDLLLITTLDPCAMCSGALLTAGFNVAVIAPDDFAGIDWSGTGDFSALPVAVHRGLSRRFGYVAVPGRRAFRGPRDFPWPAASVAPALADACASVFASSVESVRAASVEAGLPPSQLTDPATSTAASALRAAWQRAHPDAFRLRLAVPRRPDAALETYLQALVDRTPGARNAVAFIDPFGNLLCASADRYDRTPVSTAFLTVTQHYAATHFDLTNDPRMTAAARASLTGPRYGTFVFLHAPDPGLPTTLMDLGAFGSTMEGSVPVASPSPMQFYRPPRDGTIDELDALVRAMPPFYRSLVRLRPEQVER